MVEVPPKAASNDLYPWLLDPPPLTKAEKRRARAEKTRVEIAIARLQTDPALRNASRSRPTDFEPIIPRPDSDRAPTDFDWRPYLRYLRTLAALPTSAPAPESATSPSVPPFSAEQIRYRTCMAELTGGTYAWRAFRASFPEFDYEVTWAEKEFAAARDKWRVERQAVLGGARAGEGPPCFQCKHMHFPIEVDPFQKVHFHSTEIMALGNTYQREQTHRVAQERRLARQPGQALGSAEVPILHVWCDAYSRKDDEDAVREYAFCYRVLTSTAQDGNCPRFSPIS
jgi:hypothetical protein